MSADAALVLCRFLHDAATMLLWGAFAFLWLLVPGDLAEDVGRRLRWLRLGAVIVAVATTAAALPLKAATIGNGWGDALDPGMLRDVLFATSVGAAWQAEAVAAILLASTLLVPAARQVAATAITAALMLSALSLSGHAAMQSGWPGLVHRANDTLHVLAGGAWLGALVPLLPILKALDMPEREKAAGLALRRFSTFGHGAVALVVLSGVVNTAMIVGGWPVAWSQPYQRLLAVKIGFVSLMAIIAIVNRYRFVPRLGTSRAAVLRAIRFGTLTEIILGLFVIATVAWFGTLEPSADMLDETAARAAPPSLTVIAGIYAGS